MLKLLRLTKLLRILRASRILASVESHTDLSYSVFQLTKQVATAHVTLRSPRGALWEH